MKTPEKAKILWLVKINQDQETVLGFLRDKFNGCFIIGGSTGSHYTGHGESWKTKWEEYIKEGYIDIDAAIKDKLLASNWLPPKISEKDQVIVNIINNQA